MFNWLVSVAILGVLEAGAAFVPMEPGHPDERLVFLTADAGVRLVLADPEHENRAAGWGARVVSVAGGSGGA